MKFFSDNKKILATQIVSYTAIILVVSGKIFPDVGLIIGPYKYFIIAAFIAAQAVQAYFIIQEKKQKAVGETSPKDSNLP